MRESPPSSSACRAWAARVSISALLAILTSIAHAAGLDQTAVFDIPAQPLESALIAFGKQANMQVIIGPRAARGINSRAVKGTFSAGKALTELLDQSGLRYEAHGNTVTVVSANHADAARTSPVVSAQELAPRDGETVNENGGGSQSVGAPSVESEKSLQEVVVTAQKRTERVKDVPISISVLGGDDLDNSTVSGVTEALNLIPGVSATAGVQGGGTQLVIRGVGASENLFNGSSPIGYYLDSVPFGLVKSAIVPDADVYDLARVEVLRGPQGTLYGASAENGLVRVLTHDADLSQFELKARAFGSNTDGAGTNYGGDFAINVPLIEGKLALRGVVDYQNLAGWISSTNDDHINDAQLRTYRLKLDAQPVEDLSIGLSMWSSRDDYGAPSTSTVDRKITATVPEPLSTDYDAYGAKVLYNTPYFSVSSMTSYLDFSNTSLLDLEIYNIPLAIAASTDLFAHVFSEEFILNSLPHSSWQWTAGVFYRDATDRRFQAIPGVLAAPVDLKSGSRSYAVFGQLGRRFLDDRWEWAVGLRGFHDDVTSDELIQGQGLANVPLIHQTASFSHPTPRAVLTWYPNNDVTAYLSYSEGFRSGALQDPQTLHIVPGFAPLKPDRLHNYEIGLKEDFLNRQLSLDTSFYYIVWNDVQQSLVVPVASGIGTVALVNGNSISGPGLDLSVTARPVKGVNIGLTFSWNDLKMDSNVISSGAVLFSKGDRPNYASEFTGGVFAGYLFPLSASGYKGSISASANYSSPQTDHALNGTTPIINTGDALFIARAKLSLIAPKHWTATLFVDNLTNNYGAQPQSLFPVPDLSPRPRPRTVGLQLDCSL